MSFARRVQGWFSFARPDRALPDPVFPLLQVAEPLCLVGDLHGCDGHLARLLSLRKERFPDHRLVTLGDMIDRGEASAAVLRQLQAEAGVICLAGNHEAMMLEALDDPEGRAGRWLSCGGLATLISFGLHWRPGVTGSLSEMMAALRQRLDAGLETWLRRLPAWWQSGNLVMAHAGMDPAWPLAQQKRENLLWGHPDALRRPRRDGLHVAHGHYVMPHAVHGHGRIALDTGAYATGILSYALVDPGQDAAAKVRIGTIS